MTSAGFVWRRRTAGSGVAPSITDAVWDILPDTQATLQPGLAWRGEYIRDVAYAVGDVVIFTGSAAGSKAMTYVCTIAITGNQGAHTDPSGTLNANRNWAPMGRYNPVLPAAMTISHCTGLRMEIFFHLFSTFRLRRKSNASHLPGFLAGAR